MTINELLSELAGRTGLPGLALDETGVCRLVFDGQTAVDMEPAGDDGVSLHLHSILGGVPPEGKAALYRTLLAGNFLGRATSGGALAIEPQESLVFLFRTVPLKAVEIDEFMEVLAGFVRAAREWTGRLEASPELPSGSGSDASHAGMIRV